MWAVGLMYEFNLDEFVAAWLLAGAVAFFPVFIAVGRWAVQLSPVERPMRSVGCIMAAASLPIALLLVTIYGGIDDIILIVSSGAMLAAIPALLLFTCRAPGLGGGGSPALGRAGPQAVGQRRARQPRPFNSCAPQALPAPVSGGV